MPCSVALSKKKVGLIKTNLMNTEGAINDKIVQFNEDLSYFYVIGQQEAAGGKRGRRQLLK